MTRSALHWTHYDDACTARVIVMRPMQCTRHCTASNDVLEDLHAMTNPMDSEVYGLTLAEHKVIPWGRNPADHGFEHVSNKLYS